MKHTKIFFTALLGIALVFGSCKKGENDPSFTFMSRDSRITSEWELDAMNLTNITVISTGQETYTSKTTYVFDGTTMTETSDNGFGEQVESYPYSYEIVINDDGTYNETEIKDGKEYTRTDYWFWADADKSKIAVTFSGKGTYMIDRLAKDELVIKKTTETSNTDASGNVTTQSEGLIMSFTKK